MQIIGGILFFRLHRIFSALFKRLDGYVLQDVLCLILAVPQYLYSPLLVSLWNDLASPVFDAVGLAGFKSRANAFLLA